MQKLLPPLVAGLRIKVKEWRDKKYEGVSDTSKALLNWWFNEEHIIYNADGSSYNFRYYFSQREAIETVIWLYEVAQVKDKYDLIRYNTTGILSPQNVVICAGQNAGTAFTLNNTIGKVVDWQSSGDGILWQNISPVFTGTVYNANASLTDIHYRTIVKNGICPADTSNIVNSTFNPANFPEETISPVDTTICFGAKAILKTTIDAGSEYDWILQDASIVDTNGVIISDPYSISTAVTPAKNSNYIIEIKNKDCPNFLLDTFFVKVLPSIDLQVWKDTSIVLNQPLQLVANTTETGNMNFSWTPPDNLNDPTIYNPVAVINTSTDAFYYKVRVTNANGCYTQDSIKITVFNTKPDIFVPGAFTPNGDGMNDILKPIPVGISSLDFFRIFNRYGELIFSSNTIGTGWDGTFKGAAQQSGTFVYVTQGKDYKGNTIFRKGTVVLIR